MERPLTDETSTIGRSVSDLLGEVGTLCRQEIACAKAELAEKAADAGRGATQIGAGAGFCLAGTLALTAAAILGLTLLLSRWMTPMVAAIVSSAALGIVMGVIGYALMHGGGRTLSFRHLFPKRTVDTIKEDARWARQQF